MKKIYSVLFICLVSFGLKAANYTVTISGFTYTNAALSVTVGDVITIQASTMHPLCQVDATVWAAGGTTTLTGGWGVKTTDHTFTVTSAGSTFYVCQAHALSGMKGRIDAVLAAGMNESNLIVNNFNLFPNPANDKVNINFNTTSVGSVTAKLFNVLGQEVSVLVSEDNLPAQNHSFKIDLPANIPNGTYFIVVSSSQRKISKRLVISK